MLLDLDDDRRAFRGSARSWVDKDFPPERALELEKQEYLPRLTAGEIRFSIAVTEPDGGIDLLGALSTRARKVDGGWRVSGQKMSSTGAEEATYLLLLARSGDPDRPGGRPQRDLRRFRIAPISNEMARNNLAESFGPPRSY
ncbi:acyl-CoA dehydrogenase family protein [Pseudonocardia sp. RS010]|uniref:acyl-CoA dehydrogenase family protein n=1 Tax=Pseudonocardia sp. RS010 TaxID=3385979 RepID=UPI0039A1CB36